MLLEEPGVVLHRLAVLAEVGPSTAHPDRGFLAAVLAQVALHRRVQVRPKLVRALRRQDGRVEGFAQKRGGLAAVRGGFGILSVTGSSAGRAQEHKKESGRDVQEAPPWVTSA